MRPWKRAWEWIGLTGDVAFIWEGVRHLAGASVISVASGYVGALFSGPWGIVVGGVLFLIIIGWVGPRLTDRIGWVCEVEKVPDRQISSSSYYVRLHVTNKGTKNKFTAKIGRVGDYKLPSFDSCWGHEAKKSTKLAHSESDFVNVAAVAIIGGTGSVFPFQPGKDNNHYRFHNERKMADRRISVEVQIFDRSRLRETVTLILGIDDAGVGYCNEA